MREGRLSSSALPAFLILLIAFIPAWGWEPGEVVQVNKQVAPGVWLIWKAYVGECNPAFTCHPLIFGDRIYHASNGDKRDESDPYDRLYCFSWDGRLLWSFRSPDGGRTNMHGVVACPDFIAVGCENGYLYCISHDGMLRWKFETGSWVLSFSIGDVDGDGEVEVVVGSRDGNVYCIRGSGKVKWKVETGGSVYSSPALGDVDGDGEVEVVVGSCDDNVYCIGGGSGKVKWKVETGGDVNSSPALGDVDGDGRVEIAVASRDGWLYLLKVEKPCGEILWARWHGDGYGTGLLENALSYGEAARKGETDLWTPVR